MSVPVDGLTRADPVAPDPASPIEAVTHPDPYPYYARLTAERPAYLDQALGAWVISDAATVGDILADPVCRVRPVAEPVPQGLVGSAAGDVFGRLVRMTDGPAQHRLKRIVVTALRRPDPAEVAARADARARARLREPGPGSFDDLMFAIPATVVAELCGLDEHASERAGRLIGDFVAGIPAGASPPRQSAAADAAGQLRRLMAGQLDESTPGLLGELVRVARLDGWSDLVPLLANAVGLLSQTYDATAGLIGNTLLALARGQAVPDPDGLGRIVREVARYDAPIQNTRRFTAEPVCHRGTKIPADQPILLLLAAANRDPSANPEPTVFRPGRVDARLFTFGAGRHRCPGETLAVTIASAVVAVVLDVGRLPVASSVGRYRPSSNARIPFLDGRAKNYRSHHPAGARGRTGEPYEGTGEHG